MKGLWCGLIVIYWLWIWKKCSTLTLICRFLGDRQLFSTAGTWSGSTFKMSVVIILSCISNKITHIYITEFEDIVDSISISQTFPLVDTIKQTLLKVHMKDVLDAFMMYEAMLMFLK